MGGGAYSGLMTAARQAFERASADHAVLAVSIPPHVLAAR
jgi:hypothetical protein